VAAVAALLALACGLPASARVARDRSVPVVHGGRVRSVLLHVPLSVAEPAPLVLMLHGVLGNAASSVGQTGWSELADREGFVVAYPQGYASSWNAGTCCGSAAAENVDDVGFLVSVVDTIATAVPLVDRSRVYVAGFSNGGMMALRAGCERPDVFAAVASVSGTLQAPCAPSRPVSALQVTGMLDHRVPFGGLDYNGALTTALTPVPVAVGAVERGDGCSGLPRRSVSGDVTVREYPRCAGGSSVRLVLLRRTEHAWPHDDPDGWDASREVWRFLAAHRLDTSAVSGRPVLSTRVLVARAPGGVAGALDGRYDVVGGRRLAVEAWRGGRWVLVRSVVTDVAGTFHAAAPGGRVRVRYEGGVGLPSEGSA
jgi:polyhydroxybutyrate depolymerase